MKFPSPKKEKKSKRLLAVAESVSCVGPRRDSKLVHFQTAQPARTPNVTKMIERLEWLHYQVFHLVSVQPE